MSYFEYNERNQAPKKFEIAKLFKPSSFRTGLSLWTKLWPIRRAQTYAFWNFTDNYVTVTGTNQCFTETGVTELPKVFQIVLQWPNMVSFCHARHMYGCRAGSGLFLDFRIFLFWILDFGFQFWISSFWCQVSDHENKPILGILTLSCVLRGLCMHAGTLLSTHYYWDISGEEGRKTLSRMEYIRWRTSVLVLVAEL